MLFAVSASATEGEWPMAAGVYANRRFSPLREITTENAIGNSAADEKTVNYFAELLARRITAARPVLRPSDFLALRTRAAPPLPSLEPAYLIS